MSRSPGFRVRAKAGRWVIVVVAGLAAIAFAMPGGGLWGLGPPGGPALRISATGASAGAITPASPSLDEGQSVNLTAHPTGGSGNYTIQWYSGSGAGACTAGVPVGVLNSTTFSTPALFANASYCYTVTDALNATASSPWDTVGVNPSLTAPRAPGVSSTTLDANQALTVTDAVPSTGTPPYAWKWLRSVSGGSFSLATVCANDSGASAAAGANETCRVGANTLTPGDSYAFEFRVTDNGTPAEVNTSVASPTVTVNSAFSAGAVSPQSPSIDRGQSITLTANPSGGTTPYSYAWYSSTTNSGSCASGQAAGTSSKQVASPSASTYYCYQVTDSAHPSETQSSAWDLVTVRAPLAAGAPTPSNPTIDFGQSVDLSAAASGGTPTYTYQWYWASSAAGACDTGTPLGTAANQSTGAEIAGPGSYYYCYVVTDSSGNSSTHASNASVWDDVTVRPALLGPPTPTISATALDVDQTLTVTATLPTTGTSPYAWAWLLASNGGSYLSASQCTTPKGSGGTPGATVTCAIGAQALSAGTSYAFELRVTDQATPPSTATSAPSLSVSVRPALTNPAVPVPSTTALDADQPLNVTGKLPSSGTPPYSWHWLYSVGSGSFGPASVCGTTATGTGGTAGETVVCAIPGGSLTASRSYAFKLMVIDNASSPERRTSGASATVTTSSVLSAGTPTPNAPTIDLGESVNLTAAPSGGTAPYTYQWYSGGTAAACTAGTAPISGAQARTYTASPTSGTYYCYVATDAKSAASTSPAMEVTVNSALLAPPAPSLNASVLDADQPLEVTANLPTTGTAPFAWRWLVSVSGGAFANATGCSLGNGTGGVAGAAVACALPGSSLSDGLSYRFVLSVVDAALAPESVLSLPSPSVAVASPLTAPGAPAINASTWNGSAPLEVVGTLPSSGASPYAWQWLESVNGSAFEAASVCSTGAGTGALAGATVDCTVASGSAQDGQSLRFELAVTDSASNPESAVSAPSPAVTVLAPFVAAAPGPAAPKIDLSQSVNLTANAAGGSGSYTYQWYSFSTAAGCRALTSAIPGATASVYRATPAVSTYYCYEVSDGTSGLGGGASIVSAVDLVTVAPTLSPPSAPEPSSSAPSTSEGFSVSAPLPTTGTAPYTWQWLVSVDGSPFAPATECGSTTTGAGGGAGTVETCQIPANALSAGDAYVFELRVTDSAAVPVTTVSAPTATIDVQSAAPAPGTTSPSTLWPFVGAVLVLFVLLVVGTLRLRRRRPSSRSSARPPPESWAAAPSPSGARPGLATGTGHSPDELTSAAAPATQPAALAGPPVSPSPSPSVNPTAAGEEAPPRAEPMDLDSVLEEIDRIRAEMARRTQRAESADQSDAAPAEGSGDSEG